MFLRVLIHLSMHEYAPLVTGALQLLLRHFGQRQEVLQAFKQVSRYSHLSVRHKKQLLISWNFLEYLHNQASQKQEMGV